MTIFKARKLLRAKYRKQKGLFRALKPSRKAESFGVQLIGDLENNPTPRSRSA